MTSRPIQGVPLAALRDTEKLEASACSQEGTARDPPMGELPPGAEQHWRPQDHEASHLMHCRILAAYRAGGPALDGQGCWPP